MARTNKQEIIKLCNEINKREGEGAIYSIGSKHANLKINRWSTGIEDLDNIIGGGIPEGRVIEIFGPEGSGKTTMLYHLCGLQNLALDIPIEGTFDADRAKIFGNRPKQLLIYRAKYGEDAFNKTIKFAKAGIPLIGIDSVPSMVPKEDAEKVLKSADRDSIEEQRIGGTARLMNKYLPVIEEIIEVTGTSIVFVNQVRDKMNAMMFGEKTDTPGGRKLKHSCSLRIQVARRAWIEIPNKNPSNSASTEKIGFIMKCKVVKSKISNPMGECEIPVIFSRGFVSFDDVPDIRKEILKQRAAQFGKKVSSRDLEDEEDGVV
jgi:recombination protein RecA